MVGFGHEETEDLSDGVGICCVVLDPRSDTQVPRGCCGSGSHTSERGRSVVVRDMVEEVVTSTVNTSKCDWCEGPMPEHDLRNEGVYLAWDWWICKTCWMDLNED